MQELRAIFLWGEAGAVCKISSGEKINEVYILKVQKQKRKKNKASGLGI